MKQHYHPLQQLVGPTETQSHLRWFMQMCHCRVLDTVALFPHPRGPPYKSSLRYLATKYLQRSIQEGEHDSAVDARAAMDLALLKIEKGVKPAV
jgi:RNA exonuclease 1